MPGNVLGTTWDGSSFCLKNTIVKDHSFEYWESTITKRNNIGGNGQKWFHKGTRKPFANEEEFFQQLFCAIPKEDEFCEGKIDVQSLSSLVLLPDF